MNLAVLVGGSNIWLFVESMKTGRNQCCSGCWCSSGRVVLGVVYLVFWHNQAFWLLLDCSSFCETLWVWQRIASAAELAIQDFLSLLLRWPFYRSLSSHNGLLFYVLSRLDQCISVGMDPTQFAHIKGLVLQETSMPVRLFCSNTVPGFFWSCWGSCLL